MSLRTEIYLRLANDPFLVSYLAEKPEEMGEGPAIYEVWAAEDTPMPYMNLTYSFGAGADLISRRGTLDIDIFIAGNDSTVIETIQKRVKGILQGLRIRDPEDGPIFLTLENENDIPEDTPEVIHWNLTFLVRHWDKSIIGMIAERN